VGRKAYLTYFNTPKQSPEVISCWNIHSEDQS